MEQRADIPSPSATGQSRLLQKEQLQATAPPGCLWEQTGLQQVIGDLRPVTRGYGHYLTFLLPFSDQQVTRLRCKLASPQPFAPFQ